MRNKNPMPIIIKEATAEDVPFLQAMIWEVILASLTLLAHHGSENCPYFPLESRVNFFYNVQYT